MLVTTDAGGNKDSFLFDTGVTVDGALHNMDALQVKPNELHAVVLSHGHTDHTRGLIGLIRRYGRPTIPIVLHPDAFLQRKNVHPDGHETEHIPPSQRDLEAEDVEIIEERGPTMLVGGRRWSRVRFREPRRMRRVARRRWLGSMTSGSRIRGFTTIRRSS
jgi:7,8-dihydropterin-6-yl-methyl-4-(beta-D-ribofuranosyl)aminobenzene 5'-phosphate synthase